MFAKSPAALASSRERYEPSAWRTLGLTALLVSLSGCILPFDWNRNVDPPPMTSTPSTPDTVDQGDGERFNPVDGGKSDTWSRATPDVWRRQPNRFPPVNGAFVIGNVTGQPRVIRIRALRGTIHMDCDAIAGAPELALRPLHFAPAQSWLVGSGRAIPVRQRTSGACSAVLVDGTGLTRRLIFWKHSAQPMTSLSSTVQGAKNSPRHIRIVALEGAATWAKHPQLFAAPSLFDPVAPKGCALPNTEQDLTWTALPSGTQTIIDVITAPDGCSALDLLTDLGVKRVYVCMPFGMLPFKAGDDVYIAALATGHNVLPITGVELLGDTGHVRMGRGADVVYFGKGDAKISVTPGCPALHDALGTYARALSVTIQEPGKPAFQLDNGATHALAGGGKLHLVRAVTRLVWDSAATTAMATNRHVESVWSKP